MTVTTTNPSELIKKLLASLGGNQSPLQSATQVNQARLQKPPVEKERSGNGPDEIIQMALSGNKSYLDKRKKREKEDTLYEAARNNPHVLVERALQASGGSTSTDPAFGPPPKAPDRSGSVQTMAQQMAAEKGWTGSEWDALYDLVQKESSWNPEAANPTSSAAGLFQFIDSTRRNYNLPRNASPEQQIQAGLQYIADRYKTPSAALAHWLARKPINGKDVGNWY